MEFESYSSFWNYQAATPEGALAGVDGSASEETVRMTGRWAARIVGDALDLNGSQRVLELGCGVGRIARELMDRCAYWHGVDISQSMLSVAAERLSGYENVDLSLLERTSLAMIDDDELDCAYSVAVLCHMDKEDLFLYLEELSRVVKPGGLAYLETWNLDHSMGWRRWRFEVDNWQRSDQSRRKVVSRNQFCVPQEFDLYLRHAGWTLVTRWSDSPWIQVVAMNGGDEAAVQQHRQRLATASDRLAYSAEFSELFGQLLDVIYGVTPPAQMLRDLDARPQSRESELFRRYLLALWRQGEAQWGAVPTVAGA